MYRTSVVSDRPEKAAFGNTQRSFLHQNPLETGYRVGFLGISKISYFSLMRV